MIDAELRAERRRRVLEAMREEGVDVVVAGRRDDVAYLTGASGLWTAGTRPFGAACVAVAATGEVHLLSSWDAGVPAEIPFEHLYGVTWNPSVMSEALRAIPRLADAEVLGVDALSPGFARAAGRLAPRAELRPVDDLLRRVRRFKTPGELELIARAVETAAAGVDVAVATLAEGGREADAVGAAVESMADRGVTVPAGAAVVELGAEGVAWCARIDLSVLVEGYEGGLGRSYVRSEPSGPLRPEAPGVHDDLLSTCRAGATAGDLRAAAAPASSWRVRGCGLGYEPPVLDDELGDGTVLEAGTVLSVATTAYDDLRPSRRDLVLVTEGPAEVL